MNNDVLKISNLYDLNETIAAKVFEGCTYPWEVLAKIGDFIVELGNSLPEDEYEKRGENIWVHRTANVFPSAYIAGPAIIGKDAEVRHCAFIRGKAIVGEGAVVGNSTELKNVILFNKVQVPHYNYVGDSILGFKAHMGAGSITSNVKSDKKLITIKGPDSGIFGVFPMYLRAFHLSAIGYAEEFFFSLLWQLLLQRLQVKELFYKLSDI